MGFAGCHNPIDGLHFLPGQFQSSEAARAPSVPLASLTPT